MFPVGPGWNKSVHFGFLKELNVLRQFVCPGMPDELVSSNCVKVSSTQGSNRAVHGGHIRLPNKGRATGAYIKTFLMLALY